MKTTVKQEAGNQAHWDIDSRNDAWKIHMTKEILAEGKLLITVMDANSLRSDQLIGVGNIILSKLLEINHEGCDITVEVEIRDKKLEPAGKVSILLCLIQDESELLEG